MNCQISDESFVAYIRTSLSLAPNFQSLITTLSAAAHESGKKLSSTNLIWHLNEEANSVALEESINKSNEVMIAATARARNPNWKGKEKSQRESKQCSNCKKKGHTDDNCFEKGGGKEHEAPDWWKEKKKKSQATKGKSANVVNEKSNIVDDESDNYAMLTYNLPDNSTALVCTSDFQHEAHAASKSNGLILNTGASSHFSPERSRFLNYKEIDPEPVKAADGHSFKALGKGDLQ
ncbi:hypothetical protein BYT27DRAFT_7107843, partial [Phlegmacium glaucopus]